MRRSHSLTKLHAAAEMLGIFHTEADLIGLRDALARKESRKQGEEDLLDHLVYAMRYRREFANLCGKLRAGRAAFHPHDEVTCLPR